MAAAVVNPAERSNALFGAKAAAIAQIWALAKECADSDWDGEDARPLDRRAAISAVEFIQALPDGIALPEFAPEPDHGRADRTEIKLTLVERHGTLTARFWESQ